MATSYANEVIGVLDGTTPPGRTDVSKSLADLQVSIRTITMTGAAGQASGDVIVLDDVPIGFQFSHGLITASATLGTATLAIGNAAAAGKYRAAATFTAVDTPTLFGTAAAIAAAPATALERIIATIGTAALPGAGTLTVQIFYTVRTH